MARKITILTSLLLSIVFPIIVGEMLQAAWPKLVVENYPVHAVVEALGAFIAIIIALLMAILVADRNNFTAEYVWISAALISMGILDGFHALLDQGNVFVWLHSLALLSGGVIASLVWLPQQLTDSQRTWLLRWVTLFAIIMGVAGMVVPQWSPIMVIDGQFSVSAKLINLSGGIGFVVASLYFLRRYSTAGGKDVLLIANLMALFGISGFFFEMSQLWDISWWWWHLLRFVAYSLVMVYFFVLMRRYNQMLVDRTHALEQATISKDNFFASMSHELRTPLTSIIGNSQCLLEEVRVPEQTESLRAIEVAGRVQLALVNDILDMSKIESGKFTIEEPPYNLAQLVDEIDAMFSYRAKSLGLQWKAVLRDEEPYMLIGDAQRISQVLINLIGNAIKFTEEGEVSLEVHREADSLYFTVKDSGIGMSRDVMTRIFQRFEQADGSISRKFGGSGLGLYISLNLAELMGGHIDVSSNEGEGSTFELVLPYKRSDDLVQSGSGEDDEVEEQFEGHVLIAEDTVMLQQLERRMLEKRGITVTIVGNGEQAIQKATETSFDLILMDMQMPVMDGVEATRILRQLNNSTPIIAVTANVMQKHKDIFSDAGGDGFLFKPFDKEELTKVLQHYLQVKREDREDVVGVEQQSPDSMLDDLDEETQSELLAVFFRRLQTLSSELLEALKLEEWNQIRDMAHVIKGSCATYGFPALSAQGKAICDVIESEQHELLLQQVTSLIESIDRVVAENIGKC